MATRPAAFHLRRLRIFAAAGFYFHTDATIFVADVLIAWIPIITGDIRTVLGVKTFEIWRTGLKFTVWSTAWNIGTIRALLDIRSTDHGRASLKFTFRTAAAY